MGGNTGNGGNDGGNSNGAESAPLIEIIKEAILDEKYPCVTRKILVDLEKNHLYNALVNPFLIVGMKPTLTWTVSEQPWESQSFSDAHTQVNKDSYTFMSSDITFNSKMLDNASELLITAVAIHETYHAYINYMFADKQRPDLVEKSSPSYMTGLYQKSLYDNRNHNPNYTDHFNMLTSQFDNMVAILFQTYKGRYQVNDCQKALLFGMDNPGDNPSDEERRFINRTYNDVITRCGFTTNSVNTFIIQNVHASGNNGWAKLGTDCK